MVGHLVRYWQLWWAGGAFVYERGRGPTNLCLMTSLCLTRVVPHLSLNFRLSTEVQPQRL